MKIEKTEKPNIRLLEGVSTIVEAIVASKHLSVATNEMLTFVDDANVFVLVAMFSAVGLLSVGRLSVANLQVFGVVAVAMLAFLGFVSLARMKIVGVVGAATPRVVGAATPGVVEFVASVVEVHI